MKRNIWKTVWTLACIVALVSTAWAQEGPKLGPARAFPEARPTKKGSPVELARIERFRAQNTRDVQALKSSQDTRVSKMSYASDELAAYLVFNLEFDNPESCQALEAPDSAIVTRFERFADVFIDFGDWDLFDRVLNSPGLIWWEIAGFAEAPPPPVGLGEEAESRAIPDEIVRGGIDGYTGRGVIVAVIDTGIDFHHPDFIAYDDCGKATSRILYYWDTTSEAYAAGVGQPGPLNYPNGSAVGTVYSRDDLTREINAPMPRIASWDMDGHGTACAGIAAGNGNSSDGRNAGVAPQADIIAVSLGSYLENAWVMGAVCDWLEVAAGSQPLVISCSFGGQFGGRDGLRIEERQLDARFPTNQTRRAICIAAGNEGAVPLHASFTIGGEDAPGFLTWYADGYGEVEMYVDVEDPNDLRYGLIEEQDFGSEYALYYYWTRPFSDELITPIDVAPGQGGLYFYSPSGKTYTAHAYVYGPVEFIGNCRVPSHQVATPGTTPNAITVGSYDWNDQFRRGGATYLQTDPVFGRQLEIGSLSAYSNPGPLRLTESVKPEVVAPGQYYTAAAARNVSGTKDSSGFYQLFNGTSAATPYTAGIVALLMEANPDLTLSEIKGLLGEHASSDQFTSAVPNPNWGHGKLDMAAVRAMLASAAAARPQPQQAGTTNQSPRRTRRGLFGRLLGR